MHCLGTISRLRKILTILLKCPDVIQWITVCPLSTELEWVPYTLSPAPPYSLRTTFIVMDAYLRTQLTMGPDTVDPMESMWNRSRWSLLQTRRSHFNWWAPLYGIIPLTSCNALPSNQFSPIATFWLLIIDPIDAAMAMAMQWHFLLHHVNPVLSRLSN